jgi:glycosyltransferase involved in cell wall biosynthesis
MRLLVFQSIPDIHIEKYEVSQAAANFCFNLIDTKCFDKGLSLIPVNIKDNIKQKCIYTNTEFIQCRLMPHISFFRVFNNFIENIQIARKGMSAKKIWVYNITYSNLLAVVLLRFIFFKKVYAIIADYNEPTNFFSGNNLFRLIINNLNGVITLSARIKIKNKNQENVAGIIPSYKIGLIQSNLDSKKFLFSGLLNLVNGIDMAIEVFSKLPNAELYITGKDYGYCKRIDSYKNIHYMGFLSYSDYKKIFSDITFCLNFRNPTYSENINNFPSKVLEYFSHNKVVISTLEYPELSTFNYFYTPFDSAKIINLIQNLLTISSENLRKYCNHNCQLNTNFSESKWKTTLQIIEDR